MLTTTGLCLLALCLALYLLDVATCEKFSATPGHQLALVDGEEVDPSDTTAVSLSHEGQLQRLLVLPNNGGDQGPGVPTTPLTYPHDFPIASLTSRPPPIS